MTSRSSLRALLFLVTVSSSSLVAETPSTAVPRFDRAPCPSQISAEEKIDCGFLYVPENRDVAKSKTIRVPVLIFRSRSATPAPDPVLFMSGGPGNSSVGGRKSGKGIRFLDERDYIVLEQRGARLAEPALECPAINVLRGEISAGRVRDASAEKAMIAAAAACRKELLAKGIDLNGYHSAATANDIEDLRRLLKIDRWNLYGLSYSARLMLTTLRRHPSGIRSVILDSTLPPEVNFDEVSAVNLLRSLNIVFDGCAVDPDCGKRFPDVRKQFFDLVARADREPLELGLNATDVAKDARVEVRGAQVVDAIYSALHDEQAVPYIPRIIANAAAGRYDELRELVRGNQGPSRSSWGLRLSVWCGEEMPFENPARIASQVSLTLGLGGIDEGAATPKLCEAWGVKAAPAVENQPVKSDVPVLIFSGELDPDTPPEWGRQLLESMPNARMVEMRGRSHGSAFNACGTEIAVAFVKDPAASLPVDCALRKRGADFGLSTQAAK